MRVAQDALPTFTAKAYSFFHLTEGWRTNTNPASMIGKKSYTQQVPTPVEEDKGKKERIKKSERKRAVVSHQPLSAHRCWHDNSIRPSKGGHTTTAVYEGIVEGAPIGGPMSYVRMWRVRPEAPTFAVLSNLTGLSLPPVFLPSLMCIRPRPSPLTTTHFPPCLLFVKNGRLKAGQKDADDGGR